MSQERNWRQKLEPLRRLNRDQWNRLLGAFFLLGIVAGMPSLEVPEWTSAKILMILTWFVLIFLFATLLMAPLWTGPVWFLSLGVCLLAYFKLKVFYPLVMMVLWGIWFWLRSSRRGVDR